MSKRIYTILKKAFGSTAIPTGADLNDYKTVGKYYMSYALNQYTNTPTGHGFEGWAAYMRVFKQFAPTQEKWIEQRLTIGGKFLTFARRWSGTEWSPWQIVSGSIDALVARDTSGKWSYKKWANGEMEVRYSGYLTFVTGYVIVYLPKNWLFLVDFDTVKAPIITAGTRYIGATRNADVICNPGSLSYDATNNRDQFTIYGRLSGSQIAGSYYTDILIKGYYK